MEMTERPMEQAASSRLPMWPTKICVNELVAYMQRMLTAMGAAIDQSFFDSLANTRFASEIPVNGG